MSTMGKITTHILDTAIGRPAAHVRVTLSRFEAGVLHPLSSAETNTDGRVDTPLLEGDALTPGVYEIAFHVGAYFSALEPHDPLVFLDVIPLRFGVADAAAHYHVPLLVTPWSYATYRGS